LLRLFDFSLLGIYGLAGNLIGTASGLIVRNCRVVLYPRCSEYFRTDRANARRRYYSENRKLLMVGALLPASIAGFSELIVTVLYDARYAGAAYALMTLGLGITMYSFQNASESLMIASGKTLVGLIGNMVRIFSLIPLSLVGYYFFGFHGFLWFSLAAGLPVSAYFYWEQHRQNLLDVRDEAIRVALAIGIFFSCIALSAVAMYFLPTGFRHFRFK
jgi:lipopolysaccharide exporter